MMTLRSLLLVLKTTIKPLITYEGKPRLWRDARKPQRVLLDLAVVLIRNYYSPMKNSNYTCILTIATIPGIRAVTVVNLSTVAVNQ